MRPSRTFRPAAVTTGHAAVLLDETWLAAFRAERTERERRRMFVGSVRHDHFRGSEKAGVDHVAFDDRADRGDEGGDITSLAPMPAARVEHGLQLFRDESDVAAATEHGADHARQGDHPRVMLHVLGVQENFKGAPFPILLDVIDRDIESVLALRPPQFVGGADELLLTRRDRRMRRAGERSPLAWWSTGWSR